MIPHITRRVRSGHGWAYRWGWIGTLLALSALMPAWGADALPREDTSKPAGERTGEPTETSPADSPKIHPVLERSLTESSSDKEWTVWVLFRDKGLTAGGRAAALDEVGRTMPAGVKARRSRVRGVPLVDSRDLPVHEPYLQAVQSLGGKLRQRTKWLNGGSFILTVGQLRDVARLPFVRELIPVARGETDAEKSDSAEKPNSGTPTGGVADDVGSDGELDYGPSLGQLTELNIPPVHEAGFSGAGVHVMMLDTGFFKEHDAFAHTILVSEWDYVFGDGNVQNEPEDHESAHGHGTATWSTCGGFDPGNIVGPAYGASFHLAKTEDIRSETQVEEDNYVAALERADSLGVWVTSASLSYLIWDDGTGYEYEDLDGDTAVITRAVDIAASKGILCVNSMGNTGPSPGSLWTPADADTIIAAGAVDSLGQIVEFSGRGPTYDGRIKPELVARGLDVWRAKASGGYTHSGGTSFSCPLLGGSATLVLEAHPEWGPVEVIDALKMSADNSGSPDNDYGWGRPNVLEAIFSETPIYPLPFSLVSPPDSLETELPVSLVWESSEDLDSGEGPLYTVMFQELESGDPPIVYEGIADTTFVIPGPLSAGAEYEWQIFAVDEDDHERPSRETWIFVMPVASSSVSDHPLASVSRPKLILWPNPSSAGVSMRLSGTAEIGEPTRVMVFSPSGRRLMARNVSGSSWMWDGRDSAGRPVPSGIYWIRVSRQGEHVAESRWMKLR
jgi:subtilisin family serine protease